MRINHETLMRVAQETVEERSAQDRRILSVYLSGSMLGDNYSLGGSVDVDLFFIHVDSIPTKREIISVAEEAHLDIAHHLQEEYQQARLLRVHPWIGPTLKDAQVLYDPQHFMDFIQAGVRGQFDRSDHVFERAQSQAKRARQIWTAYQMMEPESTPNEILNYLKALGQAANAVASISGSPLTERRFLMEFPDRAQAIDRPGMYAGVLGLLGAPNVEVPLIFNWTKSWKTAYQAVLTEKAPARLHPARRMYYQQAFEFILEGSDPKAVLWPLIRTWTMAVNALPVDVPEREDWTEAMGQLGFLGEKFLERIRALDVFLDLIDETLETWASEHGVWTEL